jgi:hypothetical protein
MPIVKPMKLLELLWDASTRILDSQVSGMVFPSELSWSEHLQAYNG